LRGWIHVLTMLLLMSLLSACGEEDEGAKGGGNDGDRGGGRPGGKATAALPVKTEVVVRGEVTSYVETHARLQAERWVEVVSRVQGLAANLLTEEGDRVKEGQLLLNLEKEELRLQLEQAKVALQQAQGTYDRTKALQDRQMVSQQEYENARNQLDNTQVTLREVQLRLDYADIRAPIDGVVMLRSVEQGDLVRTNQVVFAVADLEPLQARIRVPEKRMTQVQVDQEARIMVDPVPDRVFPARVRRISPGVDPASGTVKVTLDVPSEGVLRPGMFATVRIITDSRTDALIIPKKALLLETDEDDVFVAREGKAQRVRIELGYTDGDRVQVVSGLEEGDQVVTVGQEGLKDNAAVRVVGAVVQAETETKIADGDSAETSGSRDKPRLRGE
jgi:membrane fusion protein (multidrug efflux system)